MEKNEVNIADIKSQFNTKNEARCWLSMLGGAGVPKADQVNTQYFADVFSGE